MKQVVIVLILFGIMLGGIVWNALYIDKEVNRFVSRLDELPDQPGQEAFEAAQAIAGEWEKQSGIIGLSVGVTVMDRVSEGMAQLVAAAQCGDYYKYRETLALLCDIVADLSRLEQFRIDNLI